MNYDLLYHNGKKLCIVSHSTLANNLHFALSSVEAEQVSVEKIETVDPTWISQRSFIVLTSDVTLKQCVVEKLKTLGANFFSAVHKNNNLGSGTKIGIGTWINCYNSSLPLDSVKIGDHCVISNYNVFSHNLIIDDYCHISAHGFFNNCHVGQGTVFGIRSSVVGQKSKIISIAPYTNFLSGSTISKDVECSGTYYGNRRVSEHSSLDQRIL